MYSQKQIRVTFQLGVGSFHTNNNSKIIEGLATQINVEQVAAPDMSKCSGKIYGMKLADMEQLTTLYFIPLEVEKRNIIKIEAGYNNNYSLLFVGELEYCYADFSTSPDVAFTFSAYSGTYAMKMAIPATSVKGTVLVSDLITKLGNQAGYKVECTLTDSIKNGVFQGSLLQQIYNIAKSVNAKVVIDNDILRVMKIDEGIKGSEVVLNKDTGLVGYPTFNNLGLSLRSEYNPDFKLQGFVVVESIVPKATGVWRVVKLHHNLSSNMVGDWSSSLEVVYV